MSGSRRLHKPGRNCRICRENGTKVGMRDRFHLLENIRQDGCLTALTEEWMDSVGRFQETGFTLGLKSPAVLSSGMIDANQAFRKMLLITGLICLLEHRLAPCARV